MSAIKEDSSIDIYIWSKWFDYQIKGNESEIKQQEEMIEEAAKFIMDVDRSKHPRWLSFLGTSGAGKSHLAKGIWKWYVNSKHFKATVKGEQIVYPGTFVHFPEMADDVLNNQNYGRFSELVPEKLVVIDEIGLEKDRFGTLRDMLVRLLCQRTDKWTVITGNITQAWIEKNMDARISSRIGRNGSVVVEVNMRDYENR